jgi:rubredoxin
MNKNTTCLNINAFTEWGPFTGSNICPRCAGDKIEVNNNVVLTSNPPQLQLRCKDCGFMFSTGFNTEWTNNDALNKLWEHDQSILGKPQVGDWSPGPQVGDFPPYDSPTIPRINWPDLPDEIPPMYPDVVIPKKDMPVGWICPKCGRGLAPHVDSCPCYQSNNIKITY